MNILKIISFSVLFFFFSSLGIVFFSTESLQPLRARVEFPNCTLITIYKTNTKFRGIQAV